MAWLAVTKPATNLGVSLIFARPTIAQAATLFIRAALFTQPNRGVVERLSMRPFPPSITRPRPLGLVTPVLALSSVIFFLFAASGACGCASVPPLPPKALELNRDG